MYSDMFRCEFPINYPKFYKFNEEDRACVEKEEMGGEKTGSGECTENGKSQPEN